MIQSLPAGGLYSEWTTLHSSPKCCGSTFVKFLNYGANNRILYSNYEDGSAVRSLKNAALLARQLGVRGPCLSGSPTYLWSHPLLPAGRLGPNHTLGPGSDVPRAVVGVTLEDQLARARVAGQEGTEHDAISHAVQDLPVEKHVRNKGRAAE